MSLRELCEIAEERQRVDFDPASFVSAVLVNINRKKGARAITPLELHPFRESQTDGARFTRGNLRAIAQAVVKTYQRKHQIQCQTPSNLDTKSPS